MLVYGHMIHHLSGSRSYSRRQHDMETTILNQLLELGGQTSVLLLAIYYLGKWVKESNEKAYKAQEKRIEALETSSEACEKDRQSLRQSLQDILTEQLKKQ
jgi:arginyl-tRNA--protein-N-Asp/Glu arginylyltransferase